MMTLYPWIKSLHVIAVISWLAGMLYLPRLFIYHMDTRLGSAEGERFKVMERRLLKLIMNPAMIVAWLCGLWLVFVAQTVSWHDGWWLVKFASVVALSGMHGAMSAWRRAFRDDRNRHGQRFYRLMNEIPTLLMVIIVVMVIARPF
jgi:putative membrane protein